MDSDTKLLFSYLYRLDVSEKEVKKEFQSSSDIPLAERLAALILDRQKKRLQTKIDFDSGPSIKGWEW